MVEWWNEHAHYVLSSCVVRPEVPMEPSYGY